MPRYDFVCPKCGEQDEVVRPMRDSDRIETCPACGADMRRVYTPPSVVGTEKGDTFWSQSLAINPDQAVEHRRLFPNVKIAPDGQLGFDSNKQRSGYCEATGFTKRSQRKEII